MLILPALPSFRDIPELLCKRKDIFVAVCLDLGVYMGVQIIFCFKLGEQVSEDCKIGEGVVVMKKVQEKTGRHNKRESKGKVLSELEHGRE